MLKIKNEKLEKIRQDKLQMKQLKQEEKERQRALVANFIKPTYKNIQKYIEDKYGFKTHTSYIAEVKRSFGLQMYDAPNAVEVLKNPRKHPTQKHVDAIVDALTYFNIIDISPMVMEKNVMMLLECR